MRHTIYAILKQKKSAQPSFMSGFMISTIYCIVFTDATLYIVYLMHNACESIYSCLVLWSPIQCASIKDSLAAYHITLVNIDLQISTTLLLYSFQSILVAFRYSLQYRHDLDYNVMLYGNELFYS